jgi:hypothetical protein
MAEFEHGATGADGSIAIGGVLVAGKFRRWEVEWMSDRLNDRGGGQKWRSTIGGELAYEGTGTFIATSNVSAETALGAEATLVLYVDADDADPYLEDTGAAITRIRRTNDYNEPNEFTISFEKSDGDPPTVNGTQLD